MALTSEPGNAGVYLSSHPKLKEPGQKDFWNTSFDPQNTNCKLSRSSLMGQ